MHYCIISEGALAGGLLLGKDVPLKRLLTLDLACAGELESLLRTGLGFRFWHIIDLNDLLIYFFFGLMITNILLPSSFGICSGKPNSISSWMNFVNNISPLSLNTIDLPLKCT